MKATIKLDGLQKSYLGYISTHLLKGTDALEYETVNTLNQILCGFGNEIQLSEKELTNVLNHVKETDMILKPALERAGKAAFGWK